jgi:hypothetical protein
MENTKAGEISLISYSPAPLRTVEIFFFPHPSVPPENYYQGKSSFLHCLLQRLNLGWGKKEMENGFRPIYS